MSKVKEGVNYDEQEFKNPVVKTGTIHGVPVLFNAEEHQEEEVLIVDNRNGDIAIYSKEVLKDCERKNMIDKGSRLYLAKLVKTY
jgi:hypothetical protein